MEFYKLQALGNDFIVARSEAITGYEADLPALARAVCHRHQGVGADGFIRLQKENGGAADFAMRIFNADGSEAEISGNGLCCVGAYVCHLNLLDSDVLRVKTAAGVKELVVLGRDGQRYRFRADMGKPILHPEAIPFIIPEELDKVVNYPLEIGNDLLHVTVTSLGNPHCAVFFQNLTEADLLCLGPTIENHPSFPNRTNVEFIEVLNRHEIKVAFWERGVGRTQSSGTGSSSAAVASILNGLTDERVRIITAIGSLDVEWKGRDRVFLTNWAEVVFKGEYEQSPR
jgi:diaminopimelate epimerase